jgi:hypothetical protein
MECVLSECSGVNSLFIFQNYKVWLVQIFNGLTFFSLQVSFVVVIGQTLFVLQVCIGFSELLRYARSEYNIKTAVHDDIRFPVQGRIYRHSIHIQ